MAKLHTKREIVKARNNIPSKTTREQKMINAFMSRWLVRVRFDYHTSLVLVKANNLRHFGALSTSF